MVLRLHRRALVLAIATGAALTIAVTATSHRSRGHGTSGPSRAASSVPAKPKSTHRGPTTTTAPDYAPQRPFAGQLLIADRGNNRLLVIDAAKNVHWQFPSASAPAPPGGFYFPDDAFFTRHGTGIITNEEEQHTIIEVAYPSGVVTASYGHPRVPGAAPG